MKIVFLHHRNTGNIGDLTCCPAQYLKFPKHVIADPLTYNEGADLLVIGGGGLMGPYFDEAISIIVKKSAYLVLWGVGSHYKEGFAMAKWTNNAELIGIRDDECGYDHVPCASCLSPFFEDFPSATKEAVGYYHSHLNWRPAQGVPARGNHNSSLRDTIDFLASGKRVVTNSYHGAYWAHLLGREVDLSENWNSKFNHMPTVDLEGARRLNLEFYNRVLSTFNLDVP